MGIATSLRKAGNLQPLASAIKNFVNQKRKEQAQKRLTQGMLDFELKNANLERFNPRTQEFDILQPNSPDQTAAQFDINTARDTSDFIEGLIPGISNLDPEQVNLAFDNIESLAKSNRPPETVKEEKPQLNKEVDNYVNEDGFRITVWQKPDGNLVETKSEQKVRQPKQKEKPGLPNPNKGLGVVNKGIKILRDFTTKAKFTSGKDESGNDVITKVSVPGYNDMSFEDYNSLKEGFKNDYIDDAISLVGDQGLDDDPETGAIAIIRKYKEQGATLDEALRKFKRENENTIDAIDIKVLRDYFTLLGF